jgi:cobalamin reductase
MDKIGKSACDQCRFCTELCPRYLLGYAVEPHQVMRSLAFTKTGEQEWNKLAALCCSCGLCTLFACPEMLYPKEACTASMAKLREAGIKFTGPEGIEQHVHPMRDGRRTPVKALKKKLDVVQYDLPAPWEDRSVNSQRVVLPLKQSAGAPNTPVVSTGQMVAKGQPIGQVPADALGAIVHASVDGTVVEVTDTQIVIERT